MGSKQSAICENKVESDAIPRKWYDDQLIKRDENVYFDVEGWYEILRNETFPTEFIPISQSMAQAFVNYYQTRYSSTKMLNTNDIELIQSMENQLKQRISNNEIFIRLSSRSPKDGKPLDPQKMSQIYREKFEELKIENPDEYLTNEGKANMQMIAFCYAQNHALKVTNEIEALNLLLSSERVYYDLNEVLDCEKMKDNKTNVIKLHDWNNHIVLRQWSQRLDPSMEFRCFVYQSKLTAITQYDYYCKYYHLQNENVIEQIKNTIIQYWKDKIQPLLDPYPEKFTNYVIDIGLIENQSTNKYDCIIIEMNPFGTTSGGSLFHWIDDNDRLRGNGNDVEIRIQRNYYPDIQDYIAFILEVNQCNMNEENNSSDDYPRPKPYYTFLNEMKSELSS